MNKSVKCAICLAIVRVLHLPCQLQAQHFCPGRLGVTGSVPAEICCRCSEYVAVIERYAETRMAASQGKVCHALAGALRALLHHWHCRVAQLEHASLAAAPPLSLQVSLSCPSAGMTEVDSLQA